MANYPRTYRLSPRVKPKASGPVFVFEPVGMDLFRPTKLAPPAGTKVRKTQPAGCPKNGTMGHTYIEDAESGEFYGLVLINSLTKESS